MNFSDKNYIVLNAVESTNNYANQLIMSKQAVEGTVVLTYFQEKGRGQRGNYWESERGKNLLTSIILFPGFLPAERQFAISKIVSLALYDFLNSETSDVSIKWPNDLYLGSRKIAGILIENGVKGRNIFSSVLGIGLNLNQKEFVSDAQNPVSLQQITGEEYNIHEVLDEVVELIFKWYQKLEEGDFEYIDFMYLDRLFRKNIWSTFKDGDGEFEAKIIGIGEFGQLILKRQNGKLSEYMFKEVEYIF
ncbi:biotin--[acetyl-CoA-carboxylase] ligase [Maribellus maritimus]|uniref:biotin--[acetyl-CoA-carboxylase] ligase n=1 Tax=Maribellus maritimus TaxID=2870838 RepID=UPI001EEAE659|nr:biotin--[acetyl-CoA-carboxylase] ligase [Maribellus maritimus]MCG6186611.1 biotin--[acetyl-CoA-carboxylase] ligase [Maribellus maritimus]